ncbi:MAG TPA: hypothetical protein VE035_14170, partial [Puia sp.]|nr:hypothetical protein [Puia sp.]
MNNQAKAIAIFLFSLAAAMRSAGQNPSSSSGGQRPADPALTFVGDKSSWHGYDRYDFIMDEETLAITPFKSLPDEGDGVKAPAKGQRRCIVVVPREAAPGKPWSWQGCYWNHEPQTEVELLRRGFFIAFITPDPGKQWDAWYNFLTEKHGLSAKPAFVGMSKGGVNEYMWATAHPDKVSCIYADNPALWLESFLKLEELAKNDVPLLHVCGSYDFLLEQHTLAVENIYHQLGGRISTVIKEGPAHHPHSIRDPKMIADWIVQNIRPESSAAPELKGITFVKSYYYPYTNTYHYLKEEDTYATCRGPLVADCYARYDEMTNSTWRITGMTILVPKNPAPGKPWVFRANRIGREATAIDLALLAKGFYIVATPVTSQAGSVREQWDTIYMRLTANGFSAKPAMEGEGTGAGEAYSWAIHNPEKVSCIYGENPVMRSLMSKGTVTDSLAPLARAGIPLLHVCGSLDPWLSSNTRIAEEKYKELGGHISVIIHNGEGHYPLGPVDPKPVVDFIAAGMKAAAVTRAAAPVLHGGPPLPPPSPARDYHFDKTISREVLENYLSRAISMEGLLNGRGDLDDNIRMLKTTGAKFIGRSICLWGGEANLLNNFERARQQVPKVHAADPDMILEACIFEIVTSQVEQVPIPDWAFTALGLPVEKRNFRYEDMLYVDGRRKDQWGKGASVPDVSRMETRLWFYFLAASYIDLGFEAIHYGQVELMNGNDKDLAIWAQVFSLARSYAVIHARRHMILCDAHTPGGGFVRDGKLLLDFHAFPLRIMEVPDKPQEAILKLGFSDGLYNTSKGGASYSGWSCEHLPYLVELDNYGVSNGPGQPGQSKGGFDWIWGYDEITWFAHQTREYRSNWLRYAQDWVQKTDPNGHLEMPGSRTERSPLDKRRWYYANNPSSAVPDGLGDEEAIRAIWEEDAKGPGQHVKEGRTAGTAAHLRIKIEGRNDDAVEQEQMNNPADQLMAGTAKVNITPDGDEPLHDSVYARSLVLELNGRRVAFVSVDLAVFTSDRVEQICKEKYGITGVMLCSSHNHSEPQKKGRSFEKGNPYTVFYEDQIVKAVGIAVRDMFPARISAGRRSFPPLGFNRLIPREDGHARESWFG